MYQILIKDNLFAHAKYSTDFQESKYIEWIRKSSKDEDICFYTDSSLYFSLQDDFKFKIAWMVESPEITTNHFSWISNNSKHFDYVLTTNQKLLDKIDNGVFIPLGGCWIKPEDQKIYKKTKLISTITSSKRMTYGQKMRHFLIDKYKNNIDVFGRGYNIIDYKLTGLKDYMFSLTIENTNQNYYFSEKLIDCFMTGTVPVYWGCDIEKFFNPKGFIMINKMEDFENVLHELTEDKYIKMLPYIEENFQLAKKYLIAEDYIWENFLNKI